MKKEYLFQTINENYQKLIDEKLYVETRLLSARNISENIIDYFYDNESIRVGFSRVSGQNRKYQDSYKGKLFYLIDNEQVDHTLKNAFINIWDEASNYAAHQKSGKGNLEFINAIVVYAKEIVRWFYLKKNQSIDFLNTDISPDHIHEPTSLPNSVPTTPQKKNKLPYVLLFILGLLLVSSILYIFILDTKNTQHEDKELVEESVKNKEETKEDIKNIDEVSNTYKTTSPNVEEKLKNNQKDSEMNVIINNQDGGKIDNIININEAKDVNL